MQLVLHFVFRTFVERLINYMASIRDNKEEIKDRMIRTALDYWNIKKIENLDPLIRLLIEALAMQLHNVSDEIADIEVRTMRRLSEVLLPEIVTVVRPAHAIVHVSPLLPELNTSLYNGFSTLSPFLGNKNNVSYSFYPVCETKLRKGSVRMIISEGNVYEVMPDQNKRLLVKKQTIPENVNRIFIGLQFESKEIDLQNLSVYFDFPNLDRRRDYLHYLSSAIWKYKGKELRTSVGLHREIPQKNKNLSDFFLQTKTDNSVNESIVDYYKSSYVSIDSPLSITAEDYVKVPLNFSSYDYEAYTEAFSEDLIWIEVDMPSQFTSNILSDIQVSINTFPVANKELRSINRMVKKDFGVIPLLVETGESFFDVVEVTDENDNLYHRTGEYNDGHHEFSYTLRQGGCETFDKRSAKDYLIRLQGLLEDELSVFSSSELNKNTENIYLIETLLHKINVMTQRSSLENTELPYYLFVEPQQKSSYFYMKYWTSYGPQANGMRIGQSLNLLGNSYGDYEEPIFLTTTVEGKNPLSERERISKFKYLLGSRNRVVTNDDIRNFCFSEYSEDLYDVTIKKGIAVSEIPGCGLQRTIDVHLVLNQKDRNEKQKQQLADDIKEKLVMQSPMTFNYRIFVE